MRYPREPSDELVITLATLIASSKVLTLTPKRRRKLTNERTEANGQS